MAAGVPLSPTQPQRGTPGPWDGSPAASTPPDAPIQAQGSGWGPQSQRKTANGGERAALSSVAIPRVRSAVESPL